MTNPFTNTPGMGLDANGGLLPGWQYVTYSNGVGQGTPINTGAASNFFAPGSTVANLAGMGTPDYAAAPNPWQGQAQQMMQRGSGNATVGQSGAQQYARHFGMTKPAASLYQYQGGFQPAQYGQSQPFNTQGNFNRSNQGGLLSGGNFAFGNPFGGGLLNY